MNKYEVGKEITFSSGNTYVITAVEKGQVSFAAPWDMEDCTTESVEDLDAVDVIVTD